MDDRQLIAQVLAGDSGAERILYDAHVDRVFRLAYRICGDLDQAKDHVQETFIRAFGKLPQFRGESALGTWIGSIAVSVALNGLRKVKRVRGRELSLEDAAEVGSVPVRADPDLKARMHQAIEDLPEGYTHEEIGTMLGIHSGTSKAQLFRARAKLRKSLADFAPEAR